MNENRTPAQEAAEDIFFGQVVIIWARWFVILSATIVALWSSVESSDMIMATLLMVPLIGINFYLHGRYLMEKPVNSRLLMIIAAVDLIFVTLNIWLSPAGQGLASPYFIYFYPLLLAFAFVFPPLVTAVYALLTLMAYSIVCLLVNFDLVFSGPDLEQLVLRLITLAATVGLGVTYWRIQRERRRTIPELAALDA